jgi:hypothetical protein
MKNNIKTNFSTTYCFYDDKRKVYESDPDTKVSDAIDEFCGWQLNLNKNSSDKILEKKVSREKMEKTSNNCKATTNFSSYTYIVHCIVDFAIWLLC